MYKYIKDLEKGDIYSTSKDDGFYLACVSNDNGLIFSTTVENFKAVEIDKTCSYGPTNSGYYQFNLSDTVYVVGKIF